MDSPISSTMVETILGPLRVRRAGAGAPAVLWHSLFVDTSTFNGVTPALGAQRELFLIDGPGHGESPGPRRRYTLQECATAALQILDFFHAGDPADWVGNAWGGHVGIVFADAYASRCRTLTTIGTPPYPLSPSERRQDALLVYLYRVLGPRPFSRIMVEALAGKGVSSTAPPAATAVREAFMRGDRLGKYWAMQSVMMHRPDLRPILPRLRVPVLVLAGRDDALLDLGEAERAARSVPDCRFFQVTGAGHVAPLLVAPDEVTRHIQQFWAGQQN